MLMGHFISFLIWITMVFGQVESFQEAFEFGSDCNCMAEITNTKQEVEKEIEDLKQQNNNLQDQFNTLQEQLAKLLESNKGYEACFEDLGSANCTGSQSGKVGIVEAIRVDGKWGPFSEWSQCSVTCGGGVQFRNRTCNNPSPHNGGKPCSGDGVQQEGCNADKCYGTKEDIEFQVDKQDRMVVLMVGGDNGNMYKSVEIVTEHGGCSNHDIPPLPEGRRGGAVGVVVHTQESENGTLKQVEVLMFCGGQMGNMEQADCWTLDFSLMEWSTAPSLLHATAFPAYTSVKERFYVVGGFHRGNALDHLQIYSEGQWQLGKPLPSKRYGACCKAYLNYLVVTGGWISDLSTGWPSDQDMVTQKEIFVYSERSRKWRNLTTPDSYIGRATHSCATITYKNTSAIALVGGLSKQLNRTCLNNCLTRPWRIDMLVLNKTGISWDHEDMEPVGAWQPAVGVAPGGELVVAGLRYRYAGTGPYRWEVMKWSPGRTSWEHLGNLTTPREMAAVLNLDLKWAWLAKKCRIKL